MNETPKKPTCPICEEGTGRVEVTWPAGAPGYAYEEEEFWDEDGQFHSHFGQPHYTYYECDNGHEWSVGGVRKCPARVCKWNEMDRDWLDEEEKE